MPKVDGTRDRRVTTSLPDPAGMLRTSGQQQLQSGFSALLRRRPEPTIKQKVSAAQRLQIIKMRGEEKTLVQIGAQFGITRERVRQIISEQGAPRINVPSINAARKRKLLVDKFLGGTDIATIAQLAGYTVSTVNQYLKIDLEVNRIDVNAIKRQRKEENDIANATLDVEKFKGQHGRLPGHGEFCRIKPLRKFYAYHSRNYRRKFSDMMKLLGYDVRATVAPKPVGYWITDKGVAEAQSRVTDFVEQHGRLPKSSELHTMLGSFFACQKRHGTDIRTLKRQLLDAASSADL